ncbi:MAG TPA: LysM peptidoglycan-binding domain-containing protein [Egibacteraceae bacterium]|nr:LysM peptidoglycan-binding domain-containing protein [Actinomycetota bacterium]HWB71613.1 LysM peptidoglycan-binding domain-containing protein [Egibacteraceae bacterium]
MAATAWQLEPAKRLRPALPEPGRAPTRRLPRRVYRRRRLMALIALAVLAAAPGALALPRLQGPVPNNAAPPSAARAALTVVVAPGDTIWELAATHLPAGEDLGAYVAEVVAFNGVEASRLQPGTVLRLPGPDTH